MTALPPERSRALSIVLRLGVFALLAFVGLNAFFALFYAIFGYFVAAVMGTFAAAGVA